MVSGEKLILVLRSQFFEYIRETLYKHALEHLDAAGLEEERGHFFFLSTVNAYQYRTFLKVCDWSGHIFGFNASPRSLTKHVYVARFHCSWQSAWCVTFKMLMHATLAADEIWGFRPEPTRNNKCEGLFRTTWPHQEAERIGKEVTKRWAILREAHGHLFQLWDYLIRPGNKIFGSPDITRKSGHLFAFFKWIYGDICDSWYYGTSKISVGLGGRSTSFRNQAHVW